MRRSPSRLVRRSLLAIALMALLPVPIVRASDVEVNLTLDAIPDTAYRGESESFTAHMTPGPLSAVILQSSPDGIVWTNYATMAHSNQDPSIWTYTGTVLVSEPLAGRGIRAYYPGEPGFLPFTTQYQLQLVRKRSAWISDLQVSSPGHPTIFPTSSPIRIQTTGSQPLKIDRFVDGAWTEIASGGTTISVDVGALGVGDHKFRGRIDSTEVVEGTTSEKTIHVEKATSTPTWLSSLNGQANNPLPAQVGVTGPEGGSSFDGPMSVKDVATDTVIATGNTGMQFTIPAMTIGTHSFLVSFEGNADYLPSSKTFEVQVGEDSVEANSVTRDYSTFYPYKDGYRDNLTMSGNRFEPITVVIRIYSPTNSLVKGVTLPAGSGPYKYAWNGRTTSGAMRAAGKYKIVQTLKDAAGTTVSFTSYANLSQKKLVTRTAYVTKLGSSITAAGDPGSGSIARSTSAGYARLYSKYPSGWVGVGYQFTVPSATVYKSIAFQVYAKSPVAMPGAYIGLQNFQTCAYNSSSDWNEGCFDHLRIIGHSPLTTMWYSTSGSPTINRYSHTVRGMVSAYAGTHTIYKVRVRVVYQVLA